MPKPTLGSPRASEPPQSASEGMPVAAGAVDLTAAHRQSPLDLVMSSEEAINAGAKSGLAVMLNGVDLPRLTKLAPLRRSEFREVLKMTMENARTPCWSYFLRILEGKRKAEGRRDEPELRLEAIAPDAAEVQL